MLSVTSNSRLSCGVVLCIHVIFPPNDGGQLKIYKSGESGRLSMIFFGQEEEVHIGWNVCVTMDKKGNDR